MTTSFASSTTLPRRRGRRPAAGEPLHIGSHLPLLADLRADPRADLRVPPRPARSERSGPVDAVVVPTYRPAANLSLAQARARSARCPLIVLCSGSSSAADVVARLERGGPSPVIAVDVPDSRSDMLGDRRYGKFGLHLQTDQFATPAGTRSDVGYKRNLGLLVARLMGWRSILFLDDDIFGLDHHDVVRAAAALRSAHGRSTIAAVSWRFPSFADNSVVCHAHRQAGGQQDVFAGSAALAVAVDEDTPFFPDVYNEDWLFHFPLLAQGRVGWAGDLGQFAFDPYDPGARRAALQEFGDTLAEGVFRLLHRARPDGPAPDLLAPARTGDWWERILEQRCRFIQDIQARVGSDPTPLRRSLDEALRKQAEFRAGTFAEFVRCWVEDSRTWRAVMSQTARSTRRPLSELPMVLEHFGIWSQVAVRIGRAGAGSRAPWRP